MLVFLLVPADLARAADAEGTVSVRVGREISVTFVQEGELLTSPTVLPEPTQGEGIVTFKLARSGPSRTLYVTNGFALPLSYKVRIRFRGRGGQVETAMAPVPPHQESLVSFADPIDELVRFDFRLKDTP
jgi:hypothetical protein